MGAQAARFRAAEEAEQHYRRMRRLLQMDGADLKALLSGHARDVAPWIESAARYGVVEAQLRLGQMRLDGLGARRDPASALGWFLRAARKGSPEAMNMAGRCHENGWGAPVDLEQAAHWYRRSAEAGHDWGEYNYADMLGLPGGMNGRQVADAARQVRPDLKVLFITGFAENAVIGNGHLAPGMAMITKPFVISTLAAKIRDLIDRQSQ